MKRVLVIAAAFGLVGMLAAAPAAAETVIVKHPRQHTVTVEHVRGHPHMTVMVAPHERRTGMFWHRGVYHARLHGPVFMYPHGWHYRLWRVGAILPRIFIAPDYFYDDYGPLGLQPPPPGYRWVRYGPDLLLVNLRTGAVEDVVQDVFD